MFRPIWPSSGVKCFVVIGETAALAFKEGQAAKSAEERRHSNHNTRAPLGEKYITTATTRAAVSPITTKHLTPDDGHIGRNMSCIKL
jgi:hypothetical protein